MLNQIIIVGRLTKEVELKKLESGMQVANITLACPRPFKNAEGLYDTDFIDIVLYGEVAKNTNEYCNKGDLIGVKGRIQTRMVEDKKIQELIAEKVTFLSNKKEGEE